MARDPLIDDVAGALHASVRLLVQRIRQTQAVEGDLTSPETSALARLDRTGPTTAAELARLERISPQSMGATLAALEQRGLIGRQRDPGDGRRVVLSVSDAGHQMVNDRRGARTEQFATALRAAFTDGELGQLLAVAPLLERLAEKL